MKVYRKHILVFLITMFVSIIATCQNNTSSETDSDTKKEINKKYDGIVEFSEIGLNNWKGTLPIAENGKTIEVEPPEILDYATNEMLKKYMYNDSTDGSLVFHAFPAQTTANTKYSRTELREQMVPGENNVNWRFSDGATMEGTMSMENISRDSNGKYHKTIIMQIHGRLTNAQRDLIGQKDNNAPPMLKIYWQDGKVRVKTKVLKNLSLSDEVILHEEAWGDDEGRTFEQEVGFRKFDLKVEVSDGKMVVSLNNNEYFVYESTSIKRWDIFENYFKAGNYLQTRDDGAFAKVKIHKLSVEH